MTGDVVPTRQMDIEAAFTRVAESYRDAKMTRGGEVSRWQPGLNSADLAVLRDSAMIRARARDLVRNNPIAKNAVRMNSDAVAGAGVKLALKIDWRSLGIKDIETAAEWQDFVIRAWESHAEGFDFQADARRQRTFSEIFSLVCDTKFTDGEALAIVEMKPGLGPYQTCLNLVDVDRLSNPDMRIDTPTLRGGIERDLYGEPLVYYIRESHPSDTSTFQAAMRWQAVPRQTSWGRPIVLHTFDHTRPEMTRGVSEFASAIVPMKMLSDYNDTELRSAITKAAYAAVIKTELDWTSAMNVIGARAIGSGGDNPLVGAMLGAMQIAAEYHNDRDITFEGVKIPHLLPNESLDIMRSEASNANFDAFEGAFLRKLAAGLGLEAHELSKNYREVNYSAARAALLAVWRTYRKRRASLVNHFAMPFFGAWLEEAVAIGAVPLPPGVTDFFAAKPYLVRGTFMAWGKPMIDPMKERQAQNLGVQMGVESLESIQADEGMNWRDSADQAAYERAYYRKLNLVHPIDQLMVPTAIGSEDSDANASAPDDDQDSPQKKQPAED